MRDPLRVALTVAALVAGGAGCSGHVSTIKQSSAKPPPAPRPHATGKPPARPLATPHLARMLGQMIVARFHGQAPSPQFLARIKKGRIGGVILFSDNVAGGLAATHALTSELQRAARSGGNPALLIMTDQEGGAVKRLPGPPTLAPSAMTSRSVALRQGRAAGGLLHSVGINVDLAPVADVERVAGSFLGTRSFGSTPKVAARGACAFAAGLGAAGVAYTLKHFPGLGRATANTDLGSVSIDATASELRRDYRAYSVCGNDPLALVMLSSASYPALTGRLPAVMSAATYRRELPLATGAPPAATISDDLESPAIQSHRMPARAAVNAGLDLLLYAQSEQASDDAYTKLLADARNSTLHRSRIAAAAQAIAALKRRLAG